MYPTDKNVQVKLGSATHTRQLHALMQMKYGLQALVCVLRLIKGAAPHQGKLSGSSVTSAKGASVPALQALLQVFPGLYGALCHRCALSSQWQACREACALAHGALQAGCPAGREPCHQFSLMSSACTS